MKYLKTRHRNSIRIILERLVLTYIERSGIKKKGKKCIAC